MKIFLDTNVIVDFLAERELFFEETEILINEIFGLKIRVYFCSITISTIEYLLKREKFSKEERVNKLNWLYNSFQIKYLNNKIVKKSLSSDFKDFEDALQYYTALDNNCDFIITRNKKDFQNSEIPCFTTQEFLDLLRKYAN